MFLCIFFSANDATNSQQSQKGRGRKKKLLDRQVKHLKILNDRRKTLRALHDEISATMTNGATTSSGTVRRKTG